MAHLRGVPEALRERYGIPIVFYDGDVPMSLPEFGGMDTGFNPYHGADPWEYDLVVSNSEGGIGRLLELGARRAEALYWGADPEFFSPQPVEKDVDVFFYGYGDKFRRDWMKTMVGEPSRLAPELDFALGGLDFQGDTGAARMLGDIPFNAFARAISAARVNLNMTRRPHATVAGSSTARPFELASSGAAIVSNPHEGIERWFEPGSELVVVESAEEARRRLPRARRRPGAGRGDGPAGARARPRRAHVRPSGPTAARARRTRDRGHCVSERGLVAVVPAWNEEGAIGRVVDEIRAFDPASTSSSSTTRRRTRPPTSPRRTARSCFGCSFNVGIGGAVQTGFRYARDGGLRDRGPARRRRAARRVRDREAARADRAPEPPTSSSALASSIPGGTLPAAVRAADRAFASSRGSSRFSAASGSRTRRPASWRSNRVGIELFAVEYPHDYPEVEATLVALRSGLRLAQVQVRHARAETGTSSITFVRSLYYIVKVTLALLVASLRRYPRVESGPPMTPLRVSIAARRVALLILVVLELVRGRRLKERYALLWLATGVVLLVLSAGARR